MLQYFSEIRKTSFKTVNYHFRLFIVNSIYCLVKIEHSSIFFFGDVQFKAYKQSFVISYVH
jgi:hypothetical protein